MNIRFLAFTIAATLAVTGCSGEDDGFSLNDRSSDNNRGFVNNGIDPNNNNGFTPPIEEEFDFARPAIYGNQVFIANETLNNVAIIDSQTLRIQTVNVGAKPTAVVGPSEPSTDSRIAVLNEGSSSVTLIHPETLALRTERVLRHSNIIAVNPQSTAAVTWFDDSTAETLPPDVDLSAVTVINTAGVFQLAVGFHIQDVSFSDDGKFAIIITDDGASVVDIEDIKKDGFSVPVPIINDALIAADPRELDIVLSPSGRYLVARSTTLAGLIMVDLETEEHTLLHLPEIPTDIDAVGSTTSIAIMLPSSSTLVLASIPEGLANLAAATDPTPPMDIDMGIADMSPDMPGADMDSTDMGTTDMGAADMNASDMTVEGPWPTLDGVTFIDIGVRGLELAELSPDGLTAFLFSPRFTEKRGVLIQDLNNSSDLQVVGFEKSIRGATSDSSGQAFVVFHTRKELPIEAGTSPADPEYIARSWAVSLLDVKAGLSRLILTADAPGEFTVYDDGARGVLFLSFEGAFNRDILVGDLRSFATDSFVVATKPDGLGPLLGQDLVYISQQHPQGRVSFVDIESQERRTITGYQLNAGID